MRKFLPFLVLALLFGCKASVETSALVSTLMAKNDAVINSDLFVEVPSCKDGKDNSKESSSLIEVKDSISFLFESTEYKECVRKGMDSYAHFTIPVNYRGSKEAVKDEPVIHLVSDADGILSVLIPPSFQKRFNQLKKQMQFGSISFEQVLNIGNDTNDEQKFFVVSSFVNKKPVVLDTVTVAKGEVITFKLSDVANQQAIDQGEVMVMQHEK